MEERNGGLVGGHFGWVMGFGLVTRDSDLLYESLVGFMLMLHSHPACCITIMEQVDASSQNTSSQDVLLG